MQSQYTVGISIEGKGDRLVVRAEDALIAALKVKAERPEASIPMYGGLTVAAISAIRRTGLPITGPKPASASASRPQAHRRAARPPEAAPAGRRLPYAPR